MVSVTEMKMLRWMCEVIRENRIRNEYIRGNVEAILKLWNILRWYSHVIRRNYLDTLRVIMEIVVARKGVEKEGN